MSKLPYALARVAIVLIFGTLDGFFSPSISTASLSYRAEPLLNENPVNRLAKPGYRFSQADDTDVIARADYSIVSRVGTKEAWEAFLRKHPTGFYSDLAKIELNRLLSQQSTNSVEANSLWLAATSGDADMTQALIETKLVSVHAKDQNGWTALAYAAAAGNADVVRILLQAGAKAFDGEQDRSPIIIAATAGEPETLLQLLRHNIPAAQINRAYSIVATRGDEELLGRMSAQLGIEEAKVAPLRTFLERRLNQSISPDQSSFLILAALHYCKEQKAEERTLCLNLVPSNADKSSAPNSQRSKKVAQKSSSKRRCSWYDMVKHCLGRCTHDQIVAGTRRFHRECR